MQLQQYDWFIHRHMAKTIISRLAAIRMKPSRIALVGVDGNISYDLLHKHYPKSLFTEYDARVEYLQVAHQIRRRALGCWRIVRGVQLRQVKEFTLPKSENIDWIWSNLGLLAQHDWVSTIDNWHAAMKPEGMLFFSHLGPDTLKELMSIWQNAGIDIQQSVLADMHDLGDMLFHHGFYDPVMDMERLSIVYTDANKLMADLEACGLWSSLHFSDRQRAVEVLIEQCSQPAGLTVTWEFIYGHAICKQVLPDNQSTIQFYPRRSVS